jgi:hypothetical protein
MIQEIEMQLLEVSDLPNVMMAWCRSRALPKQGSHVSQELSQTTYFEEMFKVHYLI